MLSLIKFTIELSLKKWAIEQITATTNAVNQPVQPINGISSNSTARWNRSSG
jgi:hypothetical protein